MQTFILYSDVDQTIIDRMANQAPDVNKRLRAINLELDSLQSEYDLFDAVREKSISIITDGSTAYDVSVLVSDNDVKTIKDFNLGTDENFDSSRFSYLDLPEFTRKVEGGIMGNFYTLYVKDGVQYLNVITVKPSATATTIKMLYHTTFKALTGAGVFQANVTNVAGIKILISSRFTELVALGAIKRLFYPAIGEDSMPYLSEIKNDYENEKAKLGLTVAKAPAKVDRKFSLRPQW